MAVHAAGVGAEANVIGSEPSSRAAPPDGLS